MALSDRILRALMESGTYLSGQELCETFGVSRTAVWKAVNKLKKEGCQIEAVTHRGYRLVSAAGTDRLSGDSLEEAFRITERFGHPAYYRRETGSTNTDIMELSDRGAPEGYCLLPDQYIR